MSIVGLLLPMFTNYCYQVVVARLHGKIGDLVIGPRSKNYDKMGDLVENLIVVLFALWGLNLMEVTMSGKMASGKHGIDKVVGQ